MPSMYFSICESLLSGTSVIRRLLACVNRILEPIVPLHRNECKEYHLSRFGVPSSGSVLFVTLKSAISSDRLLSNITFKARKAHQSQHTHESEHRLYACTD